MVNNFLQQNFASKKEAIIHIDRDGTLIDKTIVFNELNHIVSKNECYLEFYYPVETFKGKNIFGAFVDGFKKSNEVIMLSAVGLYSMIFKPKKDIQNQVGGPIKIGEIIGKLTIEGFKNSVYDGLRNFFSVISFISLALAFFNLLPFPAVDGGHIILNIYEIITRRPLKLKILYAINMIGFAILISLSLLIAFLDISKIISG